MKIALFILLFLNFSVNCASTLTIPNAKIGQNAYFEPLHAYQKEIRTYNRLKRFGQNSTDQEPVKDKTISILEKQFADKEYLADFYNKTTTFYKTNPNLENQKDLEQKFWQTKHIAKIIAFKQNYETYKNDLKQLQSTLEQIKLNDTSREAYNTILQKLIDEQINPLTETYKESYEYDQELLFNFQDTNNERLGDINLAKKITDISFNFLKTISCAENDPKKIDFLYKIYKEGTNKYKPLFQNEKPLQSNIHSLLQSIIYNNPLFTGVFDYYNDCVNKKFPQIIENAVQENLLNDVLQYYRKQLNFDVETTPEQELQKIEHNAMTIISLHLKPIVQKKFRDKYPNNLSSDEVSEIITSSIFQPQFEFKNYSEIETLINNIISSLEFPINQESIVHLIPIFHNNQNDQDTRVEKKESTKPAALKKVEVKEQKFNPEELDDIEENSESEESLKEEKTAENIGFRLGGTQEFSALVPKVKEEEEKLKNLINQNNNISSQPEEIAPPENNQSILKTKRNPSILEQRKKDIEKWKNAKLERSTSENNISKQRPKTKSTPELLSNTSHAKALVPNEIKNYQNPDPSINQNKKSSPHSSFKTPRVILFTILTLASFWFVSTMFKKLYLFIR